eukprot:1178574-Prorocentrum_minimum.AAC.1
MAICVKSYDHFKPDIAKKGGLDINVIQIFYNREQLTWCNLHADSAALRHELCRKVCCLLLSCYILCDRSTALLHELTALQKCVLPTAALH